MTTRTWQRDHTQSGERRSTLTLVVLFLGTFVLGSAELLVVGVLDLIARDLKISDSAAGSLVTAYAVGLSLGGPILAALTMRLPRRLLLQFALAAYLAVTVIAVGVGDFGVLLAARVLTGGLQGLFVGVAFTIATSVVPADRIGRAISAIIGGFAVSTALGVPLGTLLGQHLGWRGAFLTIAGVGTIVLLATVCVVPAVAQQGAGQARAQFRHAFAPPVLAILGLAIVLFAGQYAALTYLTPFLQRTSGVPAGWVSAFLLSYGAATAIGAFGGGRFADRNAARTLVIAAGALTTAFGVLLLVRGVPPLVAVLLIGWGLFGFGLVPSLQLRVVSLAGPGAALATTLPASAINAGIAVGSLLGGWALAQHGPTAPLVIALILSATAIPFALATAPLTAPGEGGRA